MAMTKVNLVLLEFLRSCQFCLSVRSLGFVKLRSVKSGSL